jgi:gamma-D-glutamyl-L-lysine dipeptidyl-peptidase
MVWPHRAMIQRDIVDLRREPRDDSERVDQAHFAEQVRILGEHGNWRYVQGEDQYFGWIPGGVAPAMSTYGPDIYVIGVLLADIHERPDPASPVVGHMPAGADIPPVRYQLEEGGSIRDIAPPDYEGWQRVGLRADGPRGPQLGFVAPLDLTEVASLPHHYPTAGDYLKTAESFIGVPYLWGGTTALGLDCSGFVQQVYRLNGVALPRDADQQAMLGRKVEEARAGDLMFFGAESVSHVALATSATEFIHAPMDGGAVERGRLGGDRKLRGIRRYLPDVPSP